MTHLIIRVRRAICIHESSRFDFDLVMYVLDCQLAFWTFFCIYRTIDTIPKGMQPGVHYPSGMKKDYEYMPEMLKAMVDALIKNEGSLPWKRKWWMMIPVWSGEQLNQYHPHQLQIPTSGLASLQVPYVLLCHARMSGKFFRMRQTHQDGITNSICLRRINDQWAERLIFLLFCKVPNHFPVVYVFNCQKLWMESTVWKSRKMFIS